MAGLHVFLVDREQRYRGGDRIIFKLRAELIGLTFFGRQVTNRRGDRGVGAERFGVAAVHRPVGLDQVHQPYTRHDFAVLDVGTHHKRSALAGDFIECVVAQATLDNPVLAQVHRVLHEERMGLQMVTLVTVCCADLARQRRHTIHRGVVVEVGTGGVTQQITQIPLVIHVVGANQYFVQRIAPVQLAQGIDGGGMGRLHRIAGRIGAPGHQTGVVIGRHEPRLIVVVIVAAVAITGIERPAVVQAMLHTQVHRIRTPGGDVEGFVQASIARDVEHLAGFRIDLRASVEWHRIFHVFVGDRDLGVLAIPGQRRRNHCLIDAAEIAPVIDVLFVGDQPVGQTAIAQWPGEIYLLASATKAGAECRDRVSGFQLWLFGHHVDDPTGVLHAIQHRRGAF